MNQRIAHLNLDAKNTLVIPTPKRLCFRVPLPESLKGTIKYRLEQSDTSYDGYLNDKCEADVLLNTSTGDAVLYVWALGETVDPFVWELSLGELPAVETLQGVQSRLNNLGLDAGIVDGIMGKQTRSAIKKFQKKVRLIIDGKVNNKTIDALTKVYGC